MHIRRAYILLFLLYVVALMVRVEFLLHAQAKENLASFIGAATVEGIVAADPDLRATSLHVVVNVQTVNGAPARGTLLAYAPRTAQANYGDRVVLKGTLALPEAFETQNGRTFDYPAYLQVRGISVVMQRAKLIATKPIGFSFSGALFAFKNNFQHALERVLPQPQAGVLEGMLLGARGGIPQEMLQLFVVVGFIHILVLSGTHISIVSEGIFRSLNFLPRKLLYVVGGAAIVLFAVMVGGGAAAVRSVIMGSIALLARFLHRTSAALRSLAFAAGAMLLWNPLFILDTGFILSFLATFGIITLGGAIERRLPFIPAWKKFSLRSIAATTLAAELFILPAVVYMSGVLSFVSLPVNVLLLPLVPLIMYLGFVTGLLALVHPLAASAPALVLNALLTFLLSVVKSAAALPFSSANIAAFPWWVAAMLYLPMVISAIWIYKCGAATVVGRRSSS